MIDASANFVFRLCCPGATPYGDCKVAGARRDGRARSMPRMMDCEFERARGRSWLTVVGRIVRRWRSRMPAHFWKTVELEAVDSDKAFVHSSGSESSRTVREHCNVRIDSARGGEWRKKLEKWPFVGKKFRNEMAAKFVDL